MSPHEFSRSPQPSQEQSAEQQSQPITAWLAEVNENFQNGRIPSPDGFAAFAEDVYNLGKPGQAHEADGEEVDREVLKEAREWANPRIWVIEDDSHKDKETKALAETPDDDVSRLPKKLRNSVVKEARERDMKFDDVFAERKQKAIDERNLSNAVKEFLADGQPKPIPLTEQTETPEEPLRAKVSFSPVDMARQVNQRSVAKAHAESFLQNVKDGSFNIGELSTEDKKAYHQFEAAYKKQYPKASRPFIKREYVKVLTAKLETGENLPASPAGEAANTGTVNEPAAGMGETRPKHGRRRRTTAPVTNEAKDNRAVEQPKAKPEQTKKSADNVGEPGEQMPSFEERAEELLQAFKGGKMTQEQKEALKVMAKTIVPKYEIDKDGK